MTFELLSRYPVIDVRPANEFNDAHIIASSSFPAKEIENRLHELPVRSKQLSLFGTLEQLAEAKLLLEKKGYTIAGKMLADTHQIKKLKSSKWFEQGSFSKRLWQPANVVATFIKHYAKQSPNNTGLDIACGSGRDCVYMASQGWSMTGIDYSPSSLDKLVNLAKQNNQRITPLLLDLEKHFSRLLALKQSYGAVIVVRYLHRPILDQLKTLIDDKGFIIYQTFLKGCEDFGSPKNPRFLLEPGELATVFSDFRIILDEVEFLDDGRPTNRFIAQKINQWHN